MRKENRLLVGNSAESRSTKLKEDINMDIQKISLNDYSFAQYNPRLDLQPEDEEYKQLERSIDEFGYIDPIVVNVRTHHIISGHQRVKILKKKEFLR